MKVLVFTSLYPNNVWPNHGVFVKERMCAVARLGRCELKVVAPVPYYPPVGFGLRKDYARIVRQESINGLQVYHPRYFMIPKLAMALQGWTMFLSLLPFIIRLRRDFDFDLIDAHYLYPDGFAAVLLGGVLKKPVVVSARGSDVNQFAGFRVIKRMLRYTLDTAAHSVAVCQALKDAITRLGVPSAKVSVIPNGVDETKFFPSHARQAREVLGLPSTHKIILSVGALIPRKGHDYTIRALKLLIEKHQHSDVLLLLVGSGPEHSDLEHLVRSLGLQERVRFSGEIPHDQLHLWYGAADVFCLASDREGWPNAIMESLACGTPVVATDIWGVPEIIRTDSIGLLTKRAEQQIAATLDRALNTAWSREALVDFARQHTWRRSAEAVQEVFDSVLKPHPDPRRTAGSGSESPRVCQPAA
jgi:teichuronic acid biosynthesis glycosyltransferase TuaC